jgi:YtkA-like
VGHARPFDVSFRPRVLIRLAVLLTICVLAAGCARVDVRDEELDVQWTLSPAAPAGGGDAVLEVRLSDRDRRPVRGARLRFEAHMTHPGMAPVIEPAAEERSGAYTARLRFSMAGEWVLFVKGDLPDRARLSRRLGQTKVRPGSDGGQTPGSGR